jgi:hypothetical protein
MVSSHRQTQTIENNGMHDQPGAVAVWQRITRIKASTSYTAIATTRTECRELGRVHGVTLLAPEWSVLTRNSIRGKYTGALTTSLAS